MSKSSRRTTASQQALSQPTAGHGSRSTRRPLLLGAVVLASAGGLGAIALSRAAGPSDVTSAAPAAANVDADTVAFEQEEIDLGRVPLDKAVTVSARLINHSQRRIILSQATAQTLEGC